MKKTTRHMSIGLTVSALLACSGVCAQENAQADSAVIYGFVRMDAVYDKRAQSADDWASFLMTQPADPQRKSVYLTARTSRLGVRGSLSGGKVKYQLEGDFNGSTIEQDANNASGGIRLGTFATNSMGFRLRQANVQVGNWTVGQTWSTAFDGASAPETVEFNPHLTATAIRQPQVRYSMGLGDGASLHVALENPSTFVANVDSVAGWSTHNSRPDLLARYTQQAAWGHVSLMTAMHHYQLVKGVESTTANGGLLALGGSFNLGADDRLVYGLSSGDGAGRYQWASLLQGAYQRADATLSTFKSNAFHVGYAHKWTVDVRSNLNYARAKFSDTNDFLDGLHNKRLSQLQLNTLVTFYKGVEAGIELEQGSRELMGTGAVNKESRINSMLMVAF